jgi:23S rRNA pseudouridine1911/1915/1917 synthase
MEASIIAETDSYAVVYKPPGMHSVPLKTSHTATLLDWYAGIFPPVLEVQGRQAWEGGVLHRLDYETDGLVLIAKTQAALNALCVQQERGNFVKEYGALSVGAPVPPGFPPPPDGTSRFIESAFRTFGTGRKAVRPVLEPFPHGKTITLDQGVYYRTEILEKISVEKHRYFRLRLKRGFRHQVRCHLAWIAYPLLNDVLYGGTETDDRRIPLRAETIAFYDPDSLLPLYFKIPYLFP